MARNATCSPVSSHEARAPDAGREGEAHLAWAVPWGAGRPFLMHPQSQSQGKAEHQLRTPHLLTESHISQPFGAVQKVGAANPMSVIQEGEKKKTELNSLIKRSNSLNLLCPISGATSRLSMFSRFHMLAQMPQVTLTLSLLTGFLMVLSRVARKKLPETPKEPKRSSLPHHGFLPSSTVCFWVV